MVKIEKTREIGFCFGVKRAIDILEKVARERGGVETLGAVVHNQQVLKRLADIGVRVPTVLMISGVMWWLLALTG